MADEDRHQPPGAPPAQPSGEDLVRGKRTVRAQLTNGALEARAYVAPVGLPGDVAHKTFEMKTVAVDDQADPRRRATVARGMGEALSALEGDIVDPETGEVLPPVGAVPGPSSPWLDGKRPTRLKGHMAPLRSTPPPGGAATSPGSRPGRLAYVAAAGIVVLGLAVAFWVGRQSAPTPASGAPTTPSPVTPPAPELVTTPVVAPATEALPAPKPAATSVPARPSPVAGEPSPRDPFLGGAAEDRPAAAPPPASAKAPRTDRIF